MRVPCFIEMIRYVLFDVAGTLLEKPGLFPAIQEACRESGHKRSVGEIRTKHRMLSEISHFPDRTDKSFYRRFNQELLYLLGIVPNSTLVNAIITKCQKLAWKPFPDTTALKSFPLPIGVISNFNSTLRSKLKKSFGDIFHHILVSEETGLSKPDLRFYEKAVRNIPFPPERILYIGDSLKLDYEPASKLGFRALLLDRSNFYPNLKNKISHLREIRRFVS